jgi:hypothetical protein
MESAIESRSEQELWDRLTLLLVSDPQPGWRDVYSEIVRREIERLEPAKEVEDDE